MKLAKVVPVYKKDDKLDCNNYRPVSLLPNWASEISSSNSSEIIPFSWEKKKCRVFIDLHKAFDTVNHNILISKLEYHGICEIPLAWFKRSLRNRFQYISVNGTESELLLIKHAVSQGSILGPLLYINDLYKAITFSKIHHLAEDTNFLYESPSLKDISRKINYYISRVTQWLRANRIFFNVAKTEIILFRSCRTKITKKLNFRISGQKIKTKTQTKYLGEILDEHLNFKKQIERRLAPSVWSPYL